MTEKQPDDASSCSHDLPAPGTEYLYDVSGTHEALQRATDVDDHVLLVPQPSLTDPNDPLRWPTWKRWMTFTNGLAYSFFGGVTGPIMVTAFNLLAERFDQPLQKLVYANRATLITQGLFTVFWMWVVASSCYDHH